MMHRTMEAGTQRVRDLLEAHAKKAEAGATQTVAGVVSVTVDSHLTLKAVQLLDASIDARKRATVEKAIVEAVNGAMQTVGRSSANALSELQHSDDWKAAMGELFKGDGARRD
jgi:DNA-binding protein YbaB